MTQPLSKTDPDKAPPLVLVDASSFIFRAYYALPPLTRPSDGTPVGAVYGFTTMMLKLLEQRMGSPVGVIFDAGRSSFRMEIFEDYKANRDDAPEDLVPQFALIREATEAFGFQPIELANYEADDLIATYARDAADRGQDVVIVSSDKDLMQLINDRVTMYDPIKAKVIDAVAVEEKFGVGPDKMIDMQALMGDKVDNVPGIPGIGPKTAAQLLTDYGDLEGLLAHAGEIKQNKRRETIIENADLARVSRRLVELDQNAPIPVSPGDLHAFYEVSQKLIDFISYQGFKTLVKRLENNIDTECTKKNEQNRVKLKENKPISKNKYILVNDNITLNKIILQIYDTGCFSIDTETTSLTPAAADLVGISLCIEIGKAYYIPIGHTVHQASLLDVEIDKTDIQQLPLKDVQKKLRPILEDPSILKIAHNMKYDMQIFQKCLGARVVSYADTMIMSHIIEGGGSGHGLDDLSKKYFNHNMIAYKDVCGSGKSQVTMDRLHPDDVRDYAAEDAEVTLRLYHELRPYLFDKKLLSLYERIERPLPAIVADMEQAGILVDPQILKNMSEKFAEKLEILAQDIHGEAGQPFNIASPKQVGEILFGELSLPGGKKTKTGDWSTSAGVLDDLAANPDLDQGHRDLVQKILDWRGISKLKSTYTDALQKQINPRTGRVHTSYHLAATTTGRFSSSDPNLQNIPIRTEEGRAIREAFIAEEGKVLLAADYSQIELRLAAIMADIPRLKQAFQEGKDIHAATASEMFDVPMEQMTPEIRRRAKAINFGIIYGISAFGLANQLGIARGEAAEYIKLYFQRFPELKTFMDTQKMFAKEHGYVLTHFGRRCTVHGMNDKNQARRGFAERQAINAPLQGTAADIIKLAMIAVDRTIREESLPAKMLLQVHDELVLEVDEGAAERVAACIRQVMEQVHEFEGDIRLKVDMGLGKSWAAAH